MDFEYANVRSKYYISLGLNPLYYFWLLITKRKILPTVFGKRLIAKLLRAKFNPKLELNLLRIPIDGTWCERVRGGVKVFDLQKRIVTKVYKSETDKNMIKSQIELFAKVGHLDFAPDLKDWNIDEGWYGEELIEGLSGHGFVLKEDPKITMDRYFNLVEPLLEKLIFTEPPELMPLLSYLERFKNGIRAGLNDIDDENRTKAFVFIHKMVGRCKELTHRHEENIYLVFSHGDFHQFNMFWTKRSLKLIDWEGAQRLSLLFDFYNFFFSQLYLENASLDYANEMQNAIHRLRDLISANSPQLAENLIECAELYRIVYYIERTYTFLTSFGLDSNKIVKWVEAFQAFDKKIKDRNWDLS